MEPDSAGNKKIPLESLSKEELIKKCNNLLLIAKKAKQSKDESSEELKKYKENEIKLSSDVAALKEVVESFNKKQNEFAEVQNKHKLSEEKNSELKKDFQKLEEKYASKIAECSKLEDVLKKLSDKISRLEISNSEYVEKLNDFKENYAKLDIENKVVLNKLRESEQNEIELRKKLNASEEKYIKLEMTLKEFQGKYIEECKNYEELQETLTKLQNRSSSGRCSSRSSDSLRPVYENQEYDEIVEKYNNLMEANKLNIVKIEELTKNLNENENLVKEWSVKCLSLEESYRSVPENWKDLVIENDKLRKALSESEELNEVLNLRVKESKKWEEDYKALRDWTRSQEKWFDELTVKYNEVVTDRVNIARDLEACGAKLASLESESVHANAIKDDLIRELNQAKVDVDAANKALSEKSEENLLLTDRLRASDNELKDAKTKLNEMIVVHDQLLNQVSAMESLEETNRENRTEIERLSSALKESLDALSREKEQHANTLKENETLSEKAKQGEELNVVRENARRLEEELRLRREKCEEMERTLKNIDVDGLKRQMESFEMENGELKEAMLSKEKQCLALETAEREHAEAIEGLRGELKCAKEDVRRLTDELSREKESKNRSNAEAQGAGSIEKLGSDTKLDQSTIVEEEFLSGENKIGEEIKEKMELLYGAVKEVKSLKTLVNKEVQDGFTSLQESHDKVVQEIMKTVSKLILTLQTGHSELLSEMNDMNEVLKARGETISRLEQSNESQRKELAEASSKMANFDVKMSEKKRQIDELAKELEATKVESENKDRVIKDMEEEIWKLKSNDSHAEALSSSTLSRVEEAARLMDVEESFEDRYSKLKVVAAKLKKKVTEQQKQLEEERNKSKAKADEFQSKISGFQSQIKSLMNLQAEYDRLQDECEEEKKEKISLRKALEVANEKVEGLTREVDELKKERDKFINDKTGFEAIKTKLSAQVIALKAAAKEERSKSAKLERELEKSGYEKSLVDKKLEEEKEKNKSALSLLEKQKMETKNLSILELEIAAYEKSVAELQKKLSAQDEDRKELNLLLDNQRSQCKLYLDEIAHLKSQLTAENEKAIEASNQVKRFNEESSSREVEMRERLTEISELKSALEERKKEVEEKALELANLTNEKLKLEEKSRSIHDQYSREVHSLQDMVSDLKDSLSQRDLELEELKKEFNAYKVRAQSVLRQSQKDVNQRQQRNVLEELEQLRSTSESLKTRLEDSALKMQKLVEENEVYHEEKNRLYARMQELKNSLAETRAENQELKKARQKDAEAHIEALKVQKLQSETLAHCFQKKIEDLESEHKAKIEEMNKEHEQLQKQFQKILSNLDEKTTEKREQRESKRRPSGFVPVKSDKDMLDVMLLEREECEGSESINSASPQTSGNNANLIPLDQLLNGSEEAEQGEGGSSVREFAVHRLSDKLEKSENRIKHLTALLSEAETDCARLQHLNDVLKEEIRRNQRNTEREQHAQNFEYMKNVVLKFISLHNADERIRLVPVLNTILKLSPEEENTLANAARGIVEQPNSSRGWGSYLNIWPGA